MRHIGSSAVSGRRVRQTIVITVGAIALYVLLRTLPTTESHLSYADFHTGETGLLDLCEPGSASFVPVEAVRSPVTMAFFTDEPIETDRQVNARVRLTAASGRPLTAENLLVVHTKKLHLLVTDSSLEDYQHLHPEPTDVPGEFEFSFTPRLNGHYRAYADFTPRATGRALYAGSILEVCGLQGEPVSIVSWSTEVAGVEFVLSVAEQPVRINETTTLSLAIRRADGGRLDLGLIMDAYAHMVAFDFARQGFAHLHPQELEPVSPDRATRQLSFQLNLPDPGWYRVWAQVLVAGEELFAPFTIEVIP
ncbi:MAG: hypothetical protein DRP71_08915 [Verrucomicrobia bacterium]|nr:MAG: hypothetical protein DRP71_08915 [Verrucomicrobiota bacterium]